MKKQSFMLVVLFISGAAMAQQQPPYNKKLLDSLFHKLPDLRTTIPVPMPSPEYKLFRYPERTPVNEEMNGFEKFNPGAAVINKTNRGTIYNLPLDNMAVLVPDMNRLEKMPGSSPDFRISPQSNMPNPLYPGVSGRKKKY